MITIDLISILKEFGADMRLRDSENMGPTRCEVALATEVARLREAAGKVCEAYFMTGPRIENTQERMRDLRRLLEVPK